MNKITFNEFYTQFKVRRNAVELISPYENTMYDFGDKEIEYLEEQAPDKVWSLKTKGRDLVIVSGFHLNDSIGYFVSKEPWPCEVKYVLK